MFATIRVSRFNETMQPALYGIKRSNRNYSDPYYWGKNQFNSSFPVSLSCYMRDKGMTALYVSALKGGRTLVLEKTFNFIFGTELPNDQLRFEFESHYEPFREFVQDSLEKIDVVIHDARTGLPIRPLEVKLTTLPDDGTSNRSEDLYGTEIVIRPPTMRYMALSMAEACGESNRENVKKIFEATCKDIDAQSWTSVEKMSLRKRDILSSVNTFLDAYVDLQRPLILQPLWKTKGKSPRLAENCLDVFVWSDFALARLFMDFLDTDSAKIKRQERAGLRLARFLYEWACNKKVYQQPIYDGMTYNTLGDREFAVSGKATNPYMRCERLLKPAVHKNEIKNIVLGGGQKYLSPERRFDAILYFSNDLFEEGE